jgi:dTDP-4-dehydrorhamnose 3,5-epimerase
MRRLPTRLDGPILLEPTVHGDHRGFFVETYRREVYGELGIPEELVQHNQSRSGRRVVRGMHMQIGEGLGKLVRVARGRILDVVVDVRDESPTFGEWEAFELDDEGHHQLWCPVGFAHGFCVLSDVADVVYAQSGYHAPDLERGFTYADPDVAIAWPADVELIPSERDANAPRLAEIAAELDFRYSSSATCGAARENTT